MRRSFPRNFSFARLSFRFCIAYFFSLHRSHRLGILIKKKLYHLLLDTQEYISELKSQTEKDDEPNILVDQKKIMNQIY